MRTFIHASLAFCVLGSSAVYAQANARAAFGAGVSAMESNDFDTALEHFEEAERLHPHGVNRFNIGYCQEELGQYLEAIEAYRLALESGELSESKAADARLRIERLGERVATLVVSGPPIDVSVGAQVCTSPCRVTLNPGEHLVRWDGGEQTVRIPEGATAEVIVEAPSDAEPAPPEENLVAPPTPDLQPRAGNALLITGAALSALGIAGTVGFGLRTESIKDDFDAAMGDQQRALQEDGQRMRRLTNASIAVGAAGGIIVIIGAIVRRRTGRTIAEGSSFLVHF